MRVTDICTFLFICIWTLLVRSEKAERKREMEKPSSSAATKFHREEEEGGGGDEAYSSSTMSKDMASDHLTGFALFWKNLLKASSSSTQFRTTYSSKDLYSDLIRSLLVPQSVDRGRITCLLSVKDPVVNFYGGLHGGAVAAVAEMIAIASARTVVAKDKELFLGELSISYLSAAPHNAELLVDGRVVRSGRSVTITTVEFKLKKTGQLVYTAHASFYITPVARL